MHFDLTQDEAVIIEIIANNLSGEILAGNSVLEQIETFTKISGRMSTLPKWYHSGAIVCSMGGSKKARKLVSDLKRHDTKIAGLWIQDWTGSHNTVIGLRLWWTWTLDEKLYPDFAKLTKELKKDGIETLTYINPFLTPPNFRKNKRSKYYLQAHKNGYFVKDESGEPYAQDMGGFSGTLVDFTNPMARAWFKNIIKKELIDKGVKGWMHDYGESLPFDAVLHSGQSAAKYHNEYVVEWAKLAREVIKETGHASDTTFFMRAGHLKSPKYAPSFWTGDQLTSWDKHDGIKTAVTGLLSSGFSGYSINHSDIGGYASFNNRFSGNITRSRELLYRWIELNAFTSLFRTHDGINPGMSYQINTDEDTLAFFAKFSKIFAVLAPYREKLFKAAAQKGHPVVRHPILHYPKDQTITKLDYQFMLGDQFMVAPVLDPDKPAQRVYLPRGSWVHLWSHKTISSNGKWVVINAPVGQPPVFYKKGSADGENLYKTLGSRGLL
jgi:alpha-glucosidase